MGGVPLLPLFEVIQCHRLRIELGVIGKGVTVEGTKAAKVIVGIRQSLAALLLRHVLNNVVVVVVVVGVVVATLFLLLVLGPGYRNNVVIVIVDVVVAVVGRR